jgi:hypothetical protein
VFAFSCYLESTLLGDATPYRLSQAKSATSIASAGRSIALVDAIDAAADALATLIDLRLNETMYRRHRPC